jgi:hypothetical protein
MFDCSRISNSLHIETPSYPVTKTTETILYSMASFCINCVRQNILSTQELSPFKLDRPSITNVYILIVSKHPVAFIYTSYTLTKNNNTEEVNYKRKDNRTYKERGTRRTHLEMPVTKKQTRLIWTSGRHP